MVILKIKNYKFWQDGLHAIGLTENNFMDQKLNYIHNNPVEAGRSASLNFP